MAPAKTAKKKAAADEAPPAPPFGVEDALRILTEHVFASGGVPEDLAAFLAPPESEEADVDEDAAPEESEEADVDEDAAPEESEEADVDEDAAPEEG